MEWSWLPYQESFDYDCESLFLGSLFYSLVLSAFLKIPHFWLQCESMIVTQLSDSLLPIDCSPPGSSLHGISQARILEWVAIPFSRGSSRPRDWTMVSCIAGTFFTVWVTMEALQEAWNQKVWHLQPCSSFSELFGYWSSPGLLLGHSYKEDKICKTFVRVHQFFLRIFLNFLIVKSMWSLWSICRVIISVNLSSFVHWSNSSIWVPL